MENNDLQEFRKILIKELNDTKLEYAPKYTGIYKAWLKSLNLPRKKKKKLKKKLT